MSEPDKNTASHRKRLTLRDCLCLCQRYVVLVLNSMMVAAPKRRSGTPAFLLLMLQLHLFPGALPSGVTDWDTLLNVNAP